MNCDDERRLLLFVFCVSEVSQPNGVAHPLDTVESQECRWIIGILYAVEYGGHSFASANAPPIMRLTSSSSIAWRKAPFICPPPIIVGIVDFLDHGTVNATVDRRHHVADYIWSHLIEVL